VDRRHHRIPRPAEQEGCAHSQSYLVARSGAAGQARCAVACDVSGPRLWRADGAGIPPSMELGTQKEKVYKIPAPVFLVAGTRPRRLPPPIGLTICIYQIVGSGTPMRTCIQPCLRSRHPRSSTSATCGSDSGMTQRTKTMFSASTSSCRVPR
jgi:hypothetical protein